MKLPLSEDGEACIRLEKAFARLATSARNDLEEVRKWLASELADMDKQNRVIGAENRESAASAVAMILEQMDAALQGRVRA
jgi:hypothetical protein